MGGTFNPIHIGHIDAARAAMSEMNLDEALFIPSARPPHKDKPEATPEQRLAMVELALINEPGMKVSDAELRREGASYTVDTLRELLGAEPAVYVLIIGADLLLELNTWREPEAIAELCELAVLPRTGIDSGAVAAAAEALRRSMSARITLLKTPIPDISSTMIRLRVHSGLAIEGIVPDRVIDYIDRYRLYDPPRQLSREECVATLRNTLTTDRFEHSLFVEDMSVTLARRFGMPVEQAATAGLLHDCAKCMPLSDMQNEAKRLGIRVDAERMENSGLLHAFVGAALLREHFGVTDPDVIHAVKYHNTGVKNMSRLDMLTYLADKIELGRESYPGIEQVREAAKRDLAEAVAMFMRINIEFITMAGRSVHQDTLDALQDLDRIYSSSRQE